MHQCRDPLGNIRSLVSEKMLEKLPAVCKFADNGCQVPIMLMLMLMLMLNKDDNAVAKIDIDHSLAILMLMIRNDAVVLTMICYDNENDAGGDAPISAR